jgi:hypothetical protein
MGITEPPQKEARMTRAIVGAMTLLLVASAASARLVPHWPYDKLAREADAILIAGPMSSADTNDVSSEVAFRTELVGVDTTFRVRGVLKGKFDGESFKLLHFRLKGLMPPNGPQLVAFRLPDGPHAEPVQEYLLFLKRRPDGRFEPVAGQVDAVLSVRKIDGANQR